MNVIWRYALFLNAKQTLKIPSGYKLLSVQRDPEEPERIQLWAAVNPQAEKIDLNVRIYSTGEQLEHELISNYIGTVRLVPFVWHVFAG